MRVCMYACMYVVCMCVCMCVRMYVCMYVCIYVCMYVCMCVYVCMYSKRPWRAPKEAQGEGGGANPQRLRKRAAGDTPFGAPREAPEGPQKAHLGAKKLPKRLTEAPKRRPRVHKRHSRVNWTNRERLDICPTKPLEPPKCARRRASPSFLGWPRWLRPLWSSSPESSGIQKQIQIQIQMQVQVKRILADELSREDERIRCTDKMTR